MSTKYRTKVIDQVSIEENVNAIVYLYVHAQGEIPRMLKCLTKSN